MGHLKLIENLEARIKPDNIIDLQQLLSDNPEEISDYRYIENLAKAALFSRYDIRRKNGMKGLYDFFNPHTKIWTLKDNGIIYAYLSITKACEAFLFIGRYSETRPSIEEALHPDEK